METLVLIVLLAHVIALLGLFGFARFDVAAADDDEVQSRSWMETCVPVRAQVTEYEPAGRR